MCVFFVFCFLSNPHPHPHSHTFMTYIVTAASIGGQSTWVSLHTRKSIPLESGLTYTPLTCKQNNKSCLN